MTEAEALEKLKAMVQPDTAPTLTDTDLKTALAAALIPDPAGVWPGRAGYIPTWDLDWAAAETCDMRADRQILAGDQQQITQISSEGTSLTAKIIQADWGQLGMRWRRRSIIGRATGYGGALAVTELDLAGTPYVPSSKALS